MNQQQAPRTGLSLADNLARFTQAFSSDSTLVTRSFDNQADTGIRCCAVFLDGMVNNDLVNKNIVLAVQLAQNLQNDANTLDVIARLVVSSNDVKRYNDFNELAAGMLYGDTVLLLDGENDGLVINTKGFPTRGIEEPTNEKTLQGPRDGFNESILMNMSQVRRKLQTPRLKFLYQKIGGLSNTKVCISYIDGVAKGEIVEEVKRRLANIKLDGILDSNYIREHIRDGGGFNIFKTIGVSERPDIVAAKLLEGRVAIFVDGSPGVLTVPLIFLELFQTSEDYYTSVYYASINRLIRMISFVFTITVPAVYLALVTFHQEIIPSTLLMSIAAAQNSVPFPTIVEMLLMLFAFELLREAGSRMPNNIGQALSIVGALVLGQAAVQAKLVSAPMIIVVAITSITGLMSTRMISTVLILRLLCIVGAAVIGLYGVVIVLLVILSHMFALRSFGVEYLSVLSPPDATALHDTVLRFPWGRLSYRNLFEPPLGTGKDRQK